jgi:hypothetical protein
MHRQAAIEVRMQAGASARAITTKAPLCLGRDQYILLMAGFAENTLRIGESAADRLSDPRERRVLLGISIDGHS